MQKPKRVLGVDPSIRSTGIYTGDKYILLTDHATKALKSLPIDIREFDRESGKGFAGEDKEAVKTSNVFSIINLFEQVLDEVKPDIMAIEAIAFSAKGSIDQLAGVNYAMRLAGLAGGIEGPGGHPTPPPSPLGPPPQKKKKTCLKKRGVFIQPRLCLF